MKPHAVVVGVAAALSALGPSAPARAEGTVIELELIDTFRPTPTIGPEPALPTRTVVTSVYLPASADPAPMIVLAHGFDGHPRKFSDLATAWAAAGFVVAVPRFPVTADDAPVTDPAFFADRVGDVGEQARDLSFVVDELLARSAAAGGELAGRIDSERLGFFGLSLGSLTVWTALESEPRETRVDAVIQSDGIGPTTPWPGPLLIAHSDADPIFPYADVRAELCAEPGAVGLLTLHGAAHASVAENTVTPADDVYRAATTDFWRRTLGGDADPPNPAVVASAAVTFEPAAAACPDLPTTALVRPAPRGPASPR